LETFIKQVLVVRRDLNMRKGKIGAQCAHASMKVLLQTEISRDSTTFSYEYTPVMVTWLNGDFTKVVVCVNSEDELRDIYQKALAEGIPTALIEDLGKTEFHGEKTPTVVAVGPDYAENVDRITAGLKLY
jgi:PTH2 family peptidyl-tRNA hydrolase